MDLIDKDDAGEQPLGRCYGILQELGDYYTTIGKTSKARRCYEKAATFGPDEASPYVGLGIIALQKKTRRKRKPCRLEKNAKTYCRPGLRSQ